MKSVPCCAPRISAGSASTILRRSFLLCLVLASCAQTPVAVIGGYQWVAQPKAPQCAQVVWKQVKPEQIPGYCMDAKGHAAREGTSCAIGCVVFSPYSEAEALQIRLGWDDNLLSHEYRHALLGLVHPE